MCDHDISYIITTKEHEILNEILKYITYLSTYFLRQNVCWWRQNA